MKLAQSSPTAPTGTLTMFYKSDQSTAAPDKRRFPVAERVHVRAGHG